MFDIPSIRVGKLFGIPIEVNLSWLVIFGLVAMGLGSSYFPSLPEAEGAPTWFFLLVGALTALAFFGSILLHELSHSLVAKAEGGNVDRITLFIFGGVAQMEEEPRSPLREFLMASAGPGMSLLLAAGLFLGYMVSFGRGLPWFVWAPLEYLSLINFAVAIFNMLPGFPLDGGRVLRSILWGVTGDLLKATRWAAQSGQFIGWFMVVVAVLGVLQGRVDLIWFGLIGWFIASLAGQAYRQQVVRSRVEGIRVADVMTPEPEWVPGDISVEQLAHEHFLGRRHSRYPVMHEGSIVGIVTLPAVKSVDRTEWPVVTALEITDRNLSQLIVEHDEDVMTTFPRLAGDRPGALLVVRDGRMVGIITRSDLINLVNEPSRA